MTDYEQLSELELKGVIADEAFKKKARVMRSAIEKDAEKIRGEKKRLEVLFAEARLEAIRNKEELEQERKKMAAAVAEAKDEAAKYKQELEEEKTRISAENGKISAERFLLNEISDEIAKERKELLAIKAAIEAKTKDAESLLAKTKTRQAEAEKKEREVSEREAKVLNDLKLVDEYNDKLAKLRAIVG